MDKLTGKSLLEKLEKVSEESRRDQVIACGYFEIKSDEYVIENIMKLIDPYYGKSLPSTSTISSSSFF